MEHNLISWQEAAWALRDHQVGILPTDTLYGLVGTALSVAVVERMYDLKQRNPKSPFIVLISSTEDLHLFDIENTELTTKYWPGPVSILLPTVGKKFSYIHRGTEEIAFRIPDKPELLELLKKTGPLVAPSANPEAQPPAHTIEEAQAYFDKGVDFYIDGGILDNPPSRLIRIANGQEIVLRG